MGDFVAPSGPPPPKVPQGWKAVWNPDYKEHFFVNIHTKASQWDKPEKAVYPPGEAPPPGPPSYQDTGKKDTTDTKPLGGNTTSGDERLARELQDKENQRGPGSGPSPTTTRGAADSYYNDSSALQQNQTAPPTSAAPGGTNGQDRSFLGNLMGQNQPQGSPAQGGPPMGGPQSYPPQGYPPQGYPNQGYPPQGQPPQGYPPQGYPPQGHPPPSYGQQQSYPGQGYNTQPSYPPQGYSQQPGYYGSSGPPSGHSQQPVAAASAVVKPTAAAPAKPPAAAPARSGLGTAGALAMGAGGGMLGGMLLNHALSDRGSNVSGLDLGGGLDDYDHHNGGDNDDYCGSDSD